MKLNPLTGFWASFRQEPFSYFVCYGAIAMLVMGLYEFGSTSSRLASIIAIACGFFSAIYVSFSIRRRDIDQSEHTRRKRISYLVSAAAFSLIYLRIGFAEVLSGPIWAYLIISLILFLVGAPVVAGNPGSEQNAGGNRR